MSNAGLQIMQTIKKDGVTLAYEDINLGSSPMLFVHGWGCDHSALALQADFFGRSHRVALRNHLTEYDVTSAAAGCRVPIAYIDAAVPMADLTQLRSLIPQLVTAQTLGSGDFSPLFVSDQINAMLSTFLKIYSPGGNGDRTE
jgi:hypothetical protein